MIILSFTYTRAAELNRQSSIAGISLGISSKELIQKLNVESEYLVYVDDRSIANSEDLFLVQKKDWHALYIEKLYPCATSLLALKSEKHDYSLISKIQYDEWTIKNPLFLFEDDKLVAVSGNFETLLQNRHNIFLSFDNTFGKCMYDGKTSKWKKGSEMLSIVGNREVKNINKMKNYWNTKHVLQFVWYNLEGYNNCNNKLNIQNEGEIANFFNVNKSEISIKGLTTSMNKEKIFEYLFNNKVQEIYWTSTYDGNHVVNIVNTNLTNADSIEELKKKGFQIISESKNLPDSFSFSGVLANTMGYRVKIVFYQSVIREIEFRIHDNRGLNSLPYKLLDDFAKKHKRFISRNNKSNKGYAIDSVIMMTNDNKIVLNASFDDYNFTLTSNQLSKVYNDNLSNTIISEINTLLQNINVSKMYGFELGVRNEISGGSIPEEILKKYQLIDLNFKYNLHTVNFYEGTRDNIRTDGASQYIYESSQYCCRSERIELLSDDQSLYSISTGIQPTGYSSWKETFRIRDEISEYITLYLNKRYGQGIPVRYKGRESECWKVNDNLFELIQKDERKLISTASNNCPDCNVYFSFRRLNREDIIYKYLNDTKK